MWCVRLAMAFTLLRISLSEEIPQTSDGSDYKTFLGKNCEQSYSATCLKLDLVSWVEKLNKNENVSVFPGLTLVRENGSARANTADIVADVARDFPNDPNARLDAFLLKKVQGFLNSHSIKLNLFDKENAVTGRGKKGGGGGGGAIFAAGLMMAGTLLAAALAALAALAGKALMTALISLLLSALLGMKGHGGGEKSSYEVITAHGHGHGRSGRSFEMPLPLGLQPDYKPA